MRPTCTDCAIKHLSQAAILLQESRHGYPDHIYYARGHMAEAEAELAKLYPSHSDLVRKERKLLEDDDAYAPDFTALMKKIDEECEVCSLQGNPRSNPIAWTKCELRHPEVQRKILSCVAQVEGVPGIRSPYAVCRAAIKCPG